MGRGVSVKEHEYMYIKELLSKGSSAEEIAKKLSRSPDTIRTVDYSRDYEDFVKTPTKELRKRRKKEKEEQLQIKVDDIVAAVNDETNEDDEELSFDDLRIRVSFELGETAKRAIDGLLALVGVKL